MVVYLIDNNVMMAASAYQDGSALATRAEPLDPEYRHRIHKWLSAFERSDRKIVLDEDGLIRDEYEGQMRFNRSTFEQEYGMLVLQAKIDRQQVEYVPIETELDGGDVIGKFPDHVVGITLDRADRKWIAAAHATYTYLETMPKIAYAAETDWYVIEAQLQQHGFGLRRLLPKSWYQERCRA